MEPKFAPMKPIMHMLSVMTGTKVHKRSWPMLASTNWVRLMHM